MVQKEDSSDALGLSFLRMVDQVSAHSPLTNPPFDRIDGEFMRSPMLGLFCLAALALTSGCDAFIADTCSDMLSAYSVDIDTALTTHNGCTEDAQCVSVSISTTCQGACPVAVTQAARAEFEARVTDIDQRLCVATDFAVLCGFATPGCAATQPRCVSGRCEMVQ